jgi:hypothetical protein
MLRLPALLAIALFVPSAYAFDDSSAATREAVAFEQQRAEVALSELSARYSRVWTQLPAERRSAFASAERRWLNGGRWDDHAACVAANTSAVPVELVAARCLADVTTARVESLNGALNVRVAAPQN